MNHFAIFKISLSIDVQAQALALAKFATHAYPFIQGSTHHLFTAKVAFHLALATIALYAESLTTSMSQPVQDDPGHPDLSSFRKQLRTVHITHTHQYASSSRQFRWNSSLSTSQSCHQQHTPNQAIYSQSLVNLTHLINPTKNFRGNCLLSIHILPFLITTLVILFEPSNINKVSAVICSILPLTQYLKHS